MSEFSTTRRSLRVVSYNILADCYVRVPDQPWNAFSHCQDEFLLASERNPRIIENLLRSNADIILLQEVMYEFRDGLWQLPMEYENALQAHGYVAVMQGLKQKEIAKNALRNERTIGRAIPTGLAIFWKSDIFTEFDQSKCGSGSGMTVFLQLHGLDNAVLCVNNVHLTGSPSKFDQHLLQLEGARKQIDSMKVQECLSSGQLSTVYQFICGDFNTEVAHAVENSSDELTIVGQWFHDNEFVRAPSGISWANDKSASTLDHIMFRTRQSTQKEEDSNPSLLSCAHCEPSSKDRDNSLEGGLPNKFHPSDHVMLLGDFDISA